MNATTSKPATQRKPRPKPERCIRILEQPGPDTDGWGAIQISVRLSKNRTQTDRYLVRFLPSDFGHGAMGFEVEKLDDHLATVESYQVHLSDKPEDVSCTCKGGTRHGHCKHADGLKAVAGRMWPKLHTARDARRDPEPQPEPQGDEPELDERDSGQCFPDDRDYSRFTADEI